MENNGEVALRRLKSSDPPLYLSPSPELTEATRLACQYLYSSLKPFTPKSPFEKLLTDGFDGEQIWQQIDLQSEPLLSSLRRRVSHFEKNPESISEQLNLEANRLEKKSTPLEELDGEGDDIDDADLDDFDEDEDEEELKDDEDDDEEDEEEDEDEDEDEEEEDDGTGLVEDEFLKIKELEKFLADDEAREYGYEKDEKTNKKKKRKRVEQSESDEENAEGEDDDALEDLDLGDDISDEDGDMGNIRYEDFFARNTDHKGIKGKRKPLDRYDHMEMDEEVSDDGDNQGNQNLSTHEKELLKLRSTIEDMEKANIEPKAWTMQGEITAAKRPKNSALEADLDFEHNVRPAPVITEEVTLTLEELIRKRILEEQFDDVQKPPSLPSRAPRERKELDDNKSKKGLAEVYEEEYVQKTGLVSTAMTFSDEQKKEATMLFKKLCLKLDALSHFHFTPKPVIEDMSIQANVPALAMEEIAPMATSDAAMLAPEEVFTGKGDIKEETELTQEDRKRRRAKKKRKFKAEVSKRKAPQNTLRTDSETGKEQS